MAEVFVGSTVGAEGFSRRIAIKRVLPGYSDNVGFAQMFVAEAQISAQLVHPNIVSVLDFDRDADGRLFLVMELVDGRDLDALNDSGLLPLPVVIYIIGEVLRGLGFAHDLPTTAGMRGVVHRDISPHNVLLSWEGAVKVSDFGIAKARSASEATASAFIKGKPAYMSPEQANGQPLDGRSDLFAVGVMLWEMLCGRRLFVAEDTRATLAAVLFGQIPRPRTVRGNLPKDLERVVMKLLERDLPARYATAEDAIRDLLACDDAPRGGPELLGELLASRFPGTAPLRQSMARSHASAPSIPSAVPGVIPPYSAPTLTATGSELAIAPLAPMARISAASVTPSMGVTGGTLGTRRGRLSQVLTVLAVLIASAVVAFVIASAVTHGGTSDDGQRLDQPQSQQRTDQPVAHAQGSGADPSRAAPEPMQVPVDAALPPSDAAPLDAAAPIRSELPKPGANASQPTQAGAEKKTGTLRVVAMPIVTVTVNGKSYGDSPITIKLPVGKHRVHLQNLQNLQNNIDDVLPAVMITENQTTTIDRVPK